MKYLFTCYGHENITCKHKTTLEFTKDESVTLKGDCIVGARANFSLVQLKKFIKSLGNNNKITITIEIKNNIAENKIIEKINAEINPSFDSDKEMVIRQSDFADKRTLAINADKAAFELRKDLVEFLRQPSNRIKVILNCWKE